MISKELCAEVLAVALSTGGDYAEIFAERTLSGSLYMVNSKLDEISDSVKSGAGIRVMKGTRTVYGTTTVLTREGLCALARQVAEALGQGNAPISIRLEDKKIVDLFWQRDESAITAAAAKLRRKKDMLIPP